MARRTLIVTTASEDGGVSAKARLLGGFLEASGHQVTFALPASLIRDPDLSAPSWRLFTGARPTTRALELPRQTVPGQDGAGLGGTVVAVGTWLPELGFTDYITHEAWRTLIADHHRHVAVGDDVTVAYPLAQSDAPPHLVWCAMPVAGHLRQKSLPPLQGLYTQLFIAPVLSAIEQRVLERSPLILSETRRTADRFATMGRTRPMRVLPMPVDDALFRPPEKPAPAATIGCVGPFADPFSEVDLLFDALSRLKARGLDFLLRVAGENNTTLAEIAADYGLSRMVQRTGRLDDDTLPEFLRGLDVFAVPARTECPTAVGIRALATGVPVVTTCNSDLEDWVEPGHTGYRVHFDAGELADALARIMTDRDLRQRLSVGARAVASGRYGVDAWRFQLAQAWRLVWGEEP